MGFAQFSNNVSTKLYEAISDTDVALKVLKLPSGIIWPTLNTGDWFNITITDPFSGTWEICTVNEEVDHSNSNYDLLTVARAREGTTAKSYPVNTLIENRLTAKGIKDLYDPPTWYPSIDSDGNVLWTYVPNSGQVTPPTIVNVRGPQGEPGDPSLAPQWQTKSDIFNTLEGVTPVAADCEYNYNAIQTIISNVTNLSSLVPEDLIDQLVELNDKIAAIHGSIGYLQAFDFGDPIITSTTTQPWWSFSDPTDGGSWQEALTAYAVQEVPSWGTSGIPNAVGVTNLFDNHSWFYNETISEWVDNGQTGVTAFTQQLAGIIQGKDAFGYVKAVTDSTINANVGQVVGLSNTAGSNVYLAGDGTYKNLEMPPVFSAGVLGTIKGSTSSLGDSTFMHGKVHANSDGTGYPDGYTYKVTSYTTTGNGFTDKQLFSRDITVADSYDSAVAISEAHASDIVFYPTESFGNKYELPLLGSFISFTDNEAGCVNIKVNQGPLSRVVYADAWEKISAFSSSMLVDDATWIASVESTGSCSKFSSGDGETTFRVPFVPAAIDDPMTILMKLYSIPLSIEQTQVDALTNAQNHMVHIESSWGMPDYSAGIKTDVADTTVSFTAASGDCYLYIQGIAITSSPTHFVEVRINYPGVDRFLAINRLTGVTGTEAIICSTGAFLKKGTNVTLRWDSSTTLASKFYYVYPLVKNVGASIALPDVQSYVDTVVESKAEEIYTDLGNAIDQSTGPLAQIVQDLELRMSTVRTPLDDNLTIYLSSTGNDNNDGLTSSTAKGTWAGVQSVLNSTDPKNFVVTVQVSGLIGTTNVFNYVYLAPYGYTNLKIIGTSVGNDGFLSNFIICSGTAYLNNLSFGRLGVWRNNSLSLSTSQTIRCGWLQIGDGCSCTIDGATIQFDTVQNGTPIVIDNGLLLYASGTFEQVDNNIYLHFINILGASGTAYFRQDPTWISNNISGSISDTTVYLNRGGSICGLTTAFPGNGTISKAYPCDINAKGAARAAGQVSAAGVLVAVRSFGIVSVTKTGTGVYQVTHNLANPVVMITTFSNGQSTIAESTNITTVSTFNAAGVATDLAFTIVVF